MPKYSIIVPVYRVEAYLPACIDSVLAQTSAASFELILVDDGSPDNSGRICDEYAANDPRIRVLHTENRGVSRARNLGIREACGEYLLFLDADDVWDTALLASLDSITVSTPDMALFGFSRLMDDGTIFPGTLPCIPNGETGPEYLDRLIDIFERRLKGMESSDGVRIDEHDHVMYALRGFRRMKEETEKW